MNFNSFLMLFYRELRRFLSVLYQTVFTPIVNSSLYLLVFGISLGDQIHIQATSYLAFLIPGLVMMSCLNNAFQNSSSSIISSKFTGEIQDYSIAPLSLHQIIWAMSLGSLVRGLLVCLVTLMIGEVFYYFKYAEFLAIQNYWIFSFFLFISGLCFGMLGLSVSILARNFDHLNAISTFLITPLIYLGGVFFSIQDLHPFWKTLSYFNPLFYFINGFRYGFLGLSDVSLILCLSLCLLSFFIFYILSYFILKRGNYNRW